MKLNKRLALTIAVAAVLSACNSTPERNESLETARETVAKVEASPRAGVAATDISEARKSLDRANQLDKTKGKRADSEYEAQNATMRAQIANEKILTAEAQESIAKGTEQRQAVLIEARERDARRSAAATDVAQQQTKDSESRVDSLESELAGLKAKKTERGIVLVLGDVLFDTGQATLKRGAYGTLDRLASTLRDRPGRNVVIEGHTDNVGSEQSNQGLSERRAQSVQTALQQRGVGSSQIIAVGRGESSPIDSNESDSGRRQNRRVELIFSENRQVQQ
jgi:outer membrane protein OmpA-like peptidoglycan-associated protein